MRRIKNILGLLFIIYFAYNYRSWHIGFLENNILSSIIVTPIKWSPHAIIFAILVMIITWYIKDIIYNEKSIILDMITIGLVTIISKICLNIMMLEDISYFTLFYVEHTVPIELKLLHFRNTLYLGLESIPQEQLQPMLGKINTDQDTYNEIVNRIVVDIRKLNAMQIRSYAQEFLNNIETNLNGTRSWYLKIISFLLVISPIWLNVISIYT